MVDSHLVALQNPSSRLREDDGTHWEPDLLTLCTSLLLAKIEFGATISCPSTRRKVVENRPNSLTNMTLSSIMTKSPTSNTCVEKIKISYRVNRGQYPDHVCMGHKTGRTYRFEEHLSRVAENEGETKDDRGERDER